RVQAENDFYGLMPPFLPHMSLTGLNLVHACMEQLTHSYSIRALLTQYYRRGREACSSPTFCQRLRLASSKVVLRLAILSTVCPIYTFIAMCCRLPKIFIRIIIATPAVKVYMNTVLCIVPRQLALARSDETSFHRLSQYSSKNHHLHFEISEE
ncbi:hypothetical protein L9F63_001816, partial [Diploptera punctata]